MDKRCKEWCLINHPENKSKWISKVSMFRNVHHNLTRPCLEKMASGTWRCMDDFHRKDIVKRRQSHIDVKFPCLKFAMTPVLLLLTSELLSLFWEKNESFKVITLSFKVTEDDIFFLGRRNSTQIRLHATGTDLFIYLSFEDYFLDNIFLIIWSLMNACERELKLSNHDNEKFSGKCSLTLSFCNHFWVSRIFQVTHLACWVSLCYPEVKFHTQILNCLGKKRKLSKNCNWISL